jgi:WD40 repeat protein
MPGCHGSRTSARTLLPALGHGEDALRLNATVPLAVLRGHDDEVRAVAWSPDSRQLATRSRDRTIRIWDTDNGSELAVLRPRRLDPGCGVVTSRAATGQRVRRSDGPDLGHRRWH